MKLNPSLRNKQSGQALVAAAIAMVVLAGFTGLAIDMGALRYERRVEQTAADAAAIAGAQNLNWKSGVTAGAQYAASKDGFTDGGGGGISACDGSAAIGTTCVQVLNPPSDVTFAGNTIAGGPHASDAKYVEVLIAQVEPTYFMNIFGVNSKPVVTRAVATNITGGTNMSCWWTLGLPTSAIIGIDPTGHATVNAQNCGVSDNGNMDTTGNSYSVQANTISVSGSCIGSHCGYPDIQCTSTPTGNCGALSGAPASQDPMKGITAPSQPAVSTADCFAGSTVCTCLSYSPAQVCDVSVPATQTATIHAGTYNSINVGSNSTLILEPGIYYINGPYGSGALGKDTSSGLSFSGKGQLKSDPADPGVMLYFTNGSTVNAVGGGNTPDVQLSPMTTAENSTYAGILLYQDPADTNTQLYLGGDNNSTFNGTIYAPTATLNFYGNNNVNFDGTVISYSATFTGNPTVNFGQAPTGIPIPSFLTQPILVE